MRSTACTAMLLLAAALTAVAGGKPHDAEKPCALGKLATPARMAAPLSSEEFVRLLRHDRSAAVARFHRARSLDPQAPLFKEWTLNKLGYELMSDGNHAEAVTVLELTREVYPDSANAYDSLAEAYETRGDIERALRNSEEALARLALDDHVPEDFKQKIRQASLERLRRLSSQLDPEKL